MIKYVKITNPEKGLCDVGLGANTKFYQSIGMTPLDVQQSDVDNCWYLTEKCPMKTDEQKAQEEAEYIAKLKLTKREVFLAIYNDLGLTPDEIRSGITDAKALIEFDFASEYYRGNPLIDLIGTSLGYSKIDLDYLFKNKGFPIKNSAVGGEENA